MSEVETFLLIVLASFAFGGLVAYLASMMPVSDDSP